MRHDGPDRTDTFPDRHTVEAARDGDGGALERLTAGALPLLYNVVGRAAETDLDVDDIVQDTMVAVIRALPGLRDAAKFRSWLVAIAVRQLTDARRRAGSGRLTTLEHADEWLAPEPDFATLFLLRQSLSAEQRQVAAATAWLDPSYRDLLSLWWLEACGRLSRKDIATAMDLPAAHLAVQVQRMKTQLDVARTVVRALSRTPRCPELAELAGPDDPTPSTLLRKRIARHLRGCALCSAAVGRLVPPERLLAGLPLLLPARGAEPGAGGATGWTGPADQPGHGEAGGPADAGGTSGAAHPASGGHGAGGPSRTGDGVSRSGATGGEHPYPAAAGRHATHRHVPRRPGRRGTGPARSDSGAHGGSGGHGVLGGFSAKVTGAVVAAGVATLVVAGLIVVAPSEGSADAHSAASQVKPPAVRTGTHSPTAPRSTTPRGTEPAASAKRGAATPSRTPAGKPAAKPTPAPADTPVFRTSLPAQPAAEARGTGTVRQNSAVTGRDNGQSTLYRGRSVWIFDDTTLGSPWGFLSNSGAMTADLDASDGIDLRSHTPFEPTTASVRRPVELLPRTAAEKAFEKRHDVTTGCTAATDEYCGAKFAFWPGPVISDPARDRVLVFYGKLCRGGKPGTPCSGTLGKGLGTGVAALDMRTRTVQRLTAGHGPDVRSVEGADRTMFFPDGQGFSSAALVVGRTAYVYGDCGIHGCKLARVPLASLADRSAWRFRTGGGWSTDAARGSHVIAAGAAGQSVFYAPALRAFVNVYMPYGTNTVDYQVGGSPYGPWGRSSSVLRTPSGKDPNYALFAHPEYATDRGRTQYLTYFNPTDGTQNLVRLRLTPS